MAETSTTKTITLFVPLRNFGWTYNNYLLNKDIKIRFIDDATENELLKQKGLNYLKYRTVLIYRHRYTVGKDDEMFSYIQKVDVIITFLQLYLSQDIHYEKYFRLEEIKRDDESFDNLDQSKPDNMPDLKSEWTKYESAYSTYRLSFNWYSRSLDKYIPPKESVLFLVLALEGILLKETQTELGYRFALRGAFAMSKSKEERKEHFDLLTMAYKYRSAVVHNNEKELIKIVTKIGSSSKFHQSLLDYTELILKNLVEDPLFFEKLEDKILDI